MSRIVALIIVALLGYWVHSVYVGVSEEVAWANLTAAAAHHAADRDPHAPVIFHATKGSYVVLGVPTGARKDPYEWVILNTTVRGGVERRPADGHFNLTCSYLSDLTQKESIDPAVHDFLSARCRHEEDNQDRSRGAP